MSIFRTKISVAVAAAVVAVMGLAPIAEAAETEVATETSIAKFRTRRAVVFFGDVATDDAGDCESDRRVTLFRITRRGDDRLGAVYTDEAGSWAGRLRNAREGRYYARATRSVYADEYGDLIVCRAAESRVVRVG